MFLVVEAKESFLLLSHTLSMRKSQERVIFSSVVLRPLENLIHRLFQMLGII